ncbi:MAG TPA: DsbA family protein [Bryobacteraceae bacterium]|nr:DsbA family protein [Bryobacteraceae bacterium]
MMFRLPATLALAVLILLPGSAHCQKKKQTTAEGDDLSALRSELQALRESQRKLLKDVEYIKLVVSGKQPPLENVELGLTGQSIGTKDAKVTMVEFSDFQCPFCARHVTQTHQQIIDEYVKTGKVRYVFRNFPLAQLHPLAAKAAEAALCAGDQDKYWQMHERLFKNQQALEAKELLGHATVLGLDMGKFQSCIDGAKYAQAVKNDIEEGQRLGIRGTPTFFLGVETTKDDKLKAVTLLSGAQPFTAFKEAIEKLLNPPPPATDQKSE